MRRPSRYTTRTSIGIAVLVVATVVATMLPDRRTLAAILIAVGYPLAGWLFWDGGRDAR
jgi:hypothetical protein